MNCSTPLLLKVNCICVHVFDTLEERYKLQDTVNQTLSPYHEPGFHRGGGPGIPHPPQEKSSMLIKVQWDDFAL